MFETRLDASFDSVDGALPDPAAGLAGDVNPLAVSLGTVGAWTADDQGTPADEPAVVDSDAWIRNAGKGGEKKD